MNLIKIDGISLPGADTYSVTLSDADGPNSGRSETAIMSRDRVRSNIAKIELKWSNLSTEEMKKIVSTVTPEEFAVEYFFGEVRSAQMYAGDKSISLKALSEDGMQAYWDVSANLIEY